jgi:phenylalanine-4-hydroxylase
MVRYEDEVLFSPKMGDFDMALGQEILSAFAGAADYLSFKLDEHIVSSTTIKTGVSDKELQLLALYQEVRSIRENEGSKERLSTLFEEVSIHHSNDWLLSLEIYELVYENNSAFAKAVLEHLTSLKEKRSEVAHLIENGIELLNN